MSGVLDTFTYVFKAKDEGVDKKLSDIEKKSKDAKASTEALNQSFSEFGSEARKTFESIIPGGDKFVENLKKVGEALKRAKQAGGGTGVGKPPGGGAPPPGVNGTGGLADDAKGAGMAMTAMTVAAGLAAVAVGVLTKAFVEGAQELVNSRKQMQQAGINSVQMAGAEQFAKSLKIDKSEIQKALVDLGQKTQQGFVTSHTFGNIFGIGNETTQLLKKYGIKTEDKGKLRNSAMIFDDITKKMQGMSREAAIGFGQFFGMSKDMATAIKDSGQTLTQYVAAHKAEVAAQAKAIDQARAYEKAQQGLANAWDDFRIKIGGKVLPVVTELLEDVVKVSDKVGELSTALLGFWTTLKEILNGITDWVSEHTPQSVKEGAKNLLEAGQNVGKWIKRNALDNPLEYWTGKGQEAAHESDLAQAAKDIQQATGKQATRAEAEAKLAADKAKHDEEIMKKQTQNVSDNDRAAQTQLEAANAMKVATNRFGLTTEQYFAMWAAKAGQGGGLRSSGGVTPEAFRDIYKEGHAKYAPNAEWATALYGKGAPMMAQLPNQYVTGMGINPFSGPTNPVGLKNVKVPTVPDTLLPAKQAIQGSSMAVPTPGTVNTPKPGNTVTVNTGPITIQTNSNDPNAINQALGQHLGEQLQYTLGKLNDGQKA
jgi:hypothetical protein